MSSVLMIRLRAFVPTTCVNRGRWNWPLPPDYKDVIMPPVENRLLPVLDKVPFVAPGNKYFKYPRRHSDCRGPELIHNTFMYKQYGVMAIGGGNLEDKHITQTRATINMHLNQEKMFAIWRIDAPWKSVCKRRQGKRHGGGKGDITHYVTPIRAGRVILEVGGYAEFEEVATFLQTVASRMPFSAIAIDYKGLNDLRAEYKAMMDKNINPVSYKRVVDRNIVNVRDCLMSNEYDQFWFGKYQ